MEPKEFRIGNLVYRIDRTQEIHLPIEIPMKVLNIGLFYSEICHADLSPHEVEKWQRVKNFDLSPIELSEEWLLKFGFVKEFYRINDRSVKECYVEDYIWRLEDEIHLYLREDQWWLMEEYDSLLSFKRKLKGLHDLQNLFFAITGKELTLKTN